MIITVTLNPALDRIIYLESFSPGKLNRCEKVVVRAGGKGINTARVLKTLGVEVEAFGILGAYTGDKLRDLLAEEGISSELTSSSYISRENIKIVEENGRETEINQKGEADYKSYQELKCKLEEKLEIAELLILSGSLPIGLPTDIYEKLILTAREYDVKTVLDSSGLPFRQGLEGKPFLIKPNITELSELMGLDFDKSTDIFQAAVELIKKGIENVVISTGVEGAIFVNQFEAYQIIPPLISITETTVGAGDSMVAGLASAIINKLDFLEMAKYSTAVASLYVSGEEISESQINMMKNRLKVVEGVIF